MSIWKRYGGRGIIVCKRWLHSFTAFAKDVGERPSPRHTLERINNFSNYEPGNVKWATRKTQCRNRDNNVYYEIDGKVLCIFEWAELYKIRPGTLVARLRRGMSMVEALSVPIGKANPNSGRSRVVVRSFVSLAISGRL